MRFRIPVASSEADTERGSDMLGIGLDSMTQAQKDRRNSRGGLRCTDKRNDQRWTALFSSTGHTAKVSVSNKAKLLGLNFSFNKRVLFDDKASFDNRYEVIVRLYMRVSETDKINIPYPMLAHTYFCQLAMNVEHKESGKKTWYQVPRGSDHNYIPWIARAIKFHTRLHNKITT